MAFTRFLFSAGLLLLAAGYCPTAAAQSGSPDTTQVQLPLPQASPRALLQQTVGLTDVTVEYHSPSVKGRGVWGQLVPYNQIWRAGANENTVISFSSNVHLNGKLVLAGKYSLFVLPVSDQDWQFVLNKVTTHWGAEGYDATQDVVRVPIVPEASAFRETLCYWFSDVRPTAAHLNLSWERLTGSLVIETDVHAQVLAGIEQTLAARPNNWQLLAQAAEYMVQNNLQAEQALHYINESIRLNESYTNTWIKARLMASKQDYGTAVLYARKALKLGDKDDANFKAQQPNMRIALTEWQAKAY
ncbi:DUF2911 domain-containing protein [Hymenobacter sp. J193]|uniref:DUF2911 domain-containing protein n=1 Tax=Hymenobacter sp. J193 TaxID=2898429 RepID=UPI002150D67C|nr:DUF2911 domain-containing protein [Hymenobacter sp. J193]MCR5890141.1 DUF2911 domain-containing protein [Hymenobacter sp. J193]